MSISCTLFWSQSNNHDQRKCVECKLAALFKTFVSVKLVDRIMLYQRWVSGNSVLNTVCERLQLTGMTMMFRSRKILSASGVVGPLAPSAMIYQNAKGQTVTSSCTQCFQFANLFIT